MEEQVLNFNANTDWVQYCQAKCGLLMDGGKSYVRAVVRPTSAFCVCVGKACRSSSEDFPGNAIGIAVVMDMSSGYGGSEVDRGREREIISVIGSPNGSESVIGSQLIALPPVRPRAIDWFSVGSWSGISERRL